jgi:hypothetical protein
VVINDFHILSTCIRPMKADTPLIVDTNAVLTETISGGHLQIAKSTSDLDLSKLPPCNLGNMRELSDTLAF